MRLLLAALALTLSLPVAFAGVAETVVCLRSDIQWASPEVQTIWDATQTYKCTVGSAAAGAIRSATCRDPVGGTWIEPIESILEATRTYACSVVTILV